jgi:hypothetical protein
VRRAFVPFVLAAAVAGVCSSAIAQGQTSRASLRLVSDSPVTFRGAGFHPHEHVKLVVIGGGRAVKYLVAGDLGGFVVRVRGVDPNACPGFSASATGDLGSRASFKRSPGQCAIPS